MRSTLILIFVEIYYLMYKGYYSYWPVLLYYGIWLDFTLTLDVNLTIENILKRWWDFPLTEYDDMFDGKAEVIHRHSNFYDFVIFYIIWYFARYIDDFHLNPTEIIPFINYNYESRLITEKDLKFGTKRLLECNKSLIIPMSIPIRFLITSGDVLHSWSIPEIGIKMDAVPGRLNQIITVIHRPGIFYGQCSELCGYNHGFMPIKVISVPYKNYIDWLKKRHYKKRFFGI